uniref:Putative rap1-gtpase-activating protein rap1gap n=1 Tax=Lutzomyia longipalpis TaxID=7200 RepID=A0A1B0CWI2_LUTLO
MSAICFVCNLPIMSHQVGLVWQGGNGWDDFMREQLEESTVRQRLGGRRDSAAQISSPNTPPISSVPRRRRSSIAQLTDILREWSGSSCKKNAKNTLNRRETLADLARSFPWNRTSSIDIQGVQPSSSGGYKRRESSAEVSRSGRSRQDSRQYSHTSDLVKLWNKRECQTERERDVTEVRDSRRGSGDSLRSCRHVQAPTKSLASMRRRKESGVGFEMTTSVATGPEPEITASNNLVDSSCQALPPPVVSVRRDSQSQTQSGRVYRRESKSSPDMVPKMQRLQRQATTYDEPPGTSRRDSQPTLTTDGEERRARRDSLSPDSVTTAHRSRRDSRTHLSPDRNREHDSEINRRCREKIRRQSSSTARMSRSPDSSSCCSSRDPSPSQCPPTYIVASEPSVRPSIRRQSTTEEILIARGFRRQSTTDEMIRCRNFRRQSSQSDDVCRYRGRRDSSVQIIDGTIGTMTVETTSTVFDSSTQTDPSPQYENNHYHEECLRCNSCGINLTGPNQKRARRFKNHILCDLHFADVALMECSDFMQQLRSFKPQSLGCAVARRKSSTTLIFPLPPQACSDEFCEEYPHNLIPTPGYWIECSRQKISTAGQGWNDSGSENDNESETRDRCTDLCEDDEDSDTATKKKTTIEELWEQQQGFELTSVEQETYEKHFYGTEHWNYFTNDEDLGPVILSIKQETLNGRDQFRILVRAISYTVHGLIPASCVFADRYNREEVVRSLGKEVNLNPPLTLGQLQDTPEELLKLDQVFIKSELKVGENQYTEEEILENNDTSPMFDEFLQLLGDKVRLKGFDKYKGGLDTVHDLTGLYSVHTNWRGIEIMFHVSTMLPYERHDVQKLQRKRHIGNDIVCVVRVSARIKRKPTRYEVSVVTRDEVGAYKPYLWEQSVFVRDQMFREWILTKIVNGERASYSAPKFARMQERTRSQMLEDIVANLANHAETGQIPKPYRRGSWRPIGHMRPSSPLLDSVRDQFEDHDQLAQDFQRAFINAEPQIQNPQLFDVAFLVGQSKQKVKLIGVRAILGVRSRVFQEMLYGIQTGFGSPQVPVAEILARPVPALVSPQNQKKSSNFLQVPDMEAPRPKSVPSSPMVKRAFSRLGTITGWGRSMKKQNSQLNADDKKKWASIQDFSNGKDGGKEKNPSQFLVPGLSVRVSARIKRKPTRYEVSVVTRDEVGAYKPYLWEQSVFVRDQMFREWILTKIVNGERASYSAPKFARMQERTRSQMLEDIVANLANHAETGQIPKPYRRGSWRPIGHMRPSSPLLDSVRDQFEDHDQLAQDFQRAFINAEPQIQNPQLFDVAFLVGQSKQKVKLIGVRAILGVRSRVFQEMLYGIQTGFGSPQVPVAEILARPVPALVSPQNQKKSSNFLQVPDMEAPRPKSVPSSPMVKRAFSRLGTITGWGRSMKKQNSQLNADDKKKWASIQDFSNGKDGGKEKNPSQFLVPGLSVCADVQKVDRAKLAQTEFNIIEFDSETFRVLLNYLHTGSCPLTCVTIPGLICAAEHYDLPELLQACFHHAKQFLRIEYVCSMLINLESYYWRYTSASELVNMILAFVETKAHQLFKLEEFLNLSESIVQMIMARSLEIQEIRKFEAMLAWAKNKVKTKAVTSTNNHGNSRSEFRTIMDRLTRDLKLHRISPQDLIKIVLPSKAIKNERILETLMYQANSGIYRIQDSYLEECQQRLKNQDSRYTRMRYHPMGDGKALA